jgi:hypothetical protein
MQALQKVCWQALSSSGVSKASWQMEQVAA